MSELFLSSEEPVLKAFNRAIDKFCYRHPRFGIHNLMLYIVICNAAVYLIQSMDTTDTFLNYLLFSPYHILKGEVWRLISFIFIPTTDGLLWVAVTLYFYYFIGSTLEREWGTGRFTLYYLCGLIFYIIYGFAYYFITGVTPYLDMMYFNLSMFFAFALMFPETYVLLFFFIPIKMKLLAIIDAALFAWWIIGGDLLPLVAILNLLLFCGDYFFGLFRRSRAMGAKSAKFRQEARRAKAEYDNAPYRHKCAVCGKTDAQYPNMEFRYCSRCEGYHCFCSEHINSHVHFTE